MPPMHSRLACLSLLFGVVEASSFGGPETALLLLTVFTTVVLVAMVVLRYRRRRDYLKERRHEVHELEAPIQGVPEHQQRAQGKGKEARRKRTQKGAPTTNKKAALDRAKRKSVDIQMANIDAKLKTSGAVQ